MISYVKFLLASATVLGGVTQINFSNCYCSENVNTYESNIQDISSDNRCYYLYGPILTRYPIPYPKNYFNCEDLDHREEMKSIDQIMQYCTDNEAVVLNELIVDFATICNNIVCSLFYGSQIQYEKNSYKTCGDQISDWRNSLINLSCTMSGKEYESALLFSNLHEKNITVSKLFLKLLSNSIDNMNFNVFDNPNYLYNNVNLVSLFKYLGNRILHSAHECFNFMYDQIENIKKQKNINKKEYLDSGVFSNAMTSLYDNLQSISNVLYKINDNIVTCKNYDKNTLNMHLKSTADYIKDVLDSSRIKKYYQLLKERNELLIKNTPVKNM